MPIDFNNAEEQRQAVHGPVPAGSRVLLEMEVLKPKNSSFEQPFISVSKNHLYMLWIRLTVHDGTYQGVRWTENWLLPEGQQTVDLTEKQRMACRISYSRMRAVIEAARGVDPKDTEPQAAAKRRINDWCDLNGMLFPARVGVAENGREYNGSVYWDNVVVRVITPGNREYPALMAGGEFIEVDGAVRGKSVWGGAEGGFGGSGWSSGKPRPSEQVDEIPF